MKIYALIYMDRESTETSCVTEDIFKIQEKFQLYPPQRISSEYASLTLEVWENGVFIGNGGDVVSGERIPKFIEKEIKNLMDKNRDETII